VEQPRGRGFQRMGLQVQRTMKRWTNLSTLNHLPTSTLARLGRELDRTWTQAGVWVWSARCCKPAPGNTAYVAQRAGQLARRARNPLLPRSPYTRSALRKAHRHSAACFLALCAFR
jgi:hypothetical protein